MGQQLTAGAVSATYDSHGPNEVHFYRNASKDPAGEQAGGYFADLAKALGEARHFVFIADWSFHAMTVLKRTRTLKDPPYGPEDTVGFTLAEMAKKGILVAIHVWNHVDFVMLDGPNDDGLEWLDRIAGGKRPPDLLWRSSRRSDPTSSHHQKFVVLDAPADPANPDAPERVIKAFLGGIDITKGRHDFPQHPNMHDVPETERYRAQTKISFQENSKTKTAQFNEWYNPEFVSVEADEASALTPDFPRQTWHDIHAVIIGPTAWDIVREFVGRWNKVSLPPRGDTSIGAIQKVVNLYEKILGDSNFAQQSAPAPGKDARWRGRIIRSIVQTHWGTPTLVSLKPAMADLFKWTLPGDFEKSIQDTYVDAILRAKRFVYIETQYFIGSGDQWRLDAQVNTTIRNQIPQALVQRTIEFIKAGKPFHVYVVMPLFPEGSPVSDGAIWQRFFEFQTMKYMAKEIDAEAKPRGKRWFDFVSFLFPARWDQVTQVAKSGTRTERVRKNRRYMVYVHSKLMIVDDLFAIVGSANLNERSLSGDRDTEICMFVEPAQGKENECRNQLGEFRKLLWEEHLLPRPVDANLRRFLNPESPLLSGGQVSPGRDPAWDQPETPKCVAAVMQEAIRNYLYLRRGLRTVSESTNDRGLVEFVQSGQLVTFPFDFVNDKTHLPDAGGRFGVIQTANIRPANPEGLLGRSTFDELRLLLEHKVPDGEEFLPDPGFLSDEEQKDPAVRQLWKWESQPGRGGAQLFAE